MPVEQNWEIQERTAARDAHERERLRQEAVRLLRELLGP